MTDVALLIVHYKTLGLTQQALWSFYEAYPNLSLYVVENASSDGSLEALTNLQSQIPTLRLLPQSTNVHHGPGMDFGIRSLPNPYVLLLDSDCILFKKGLVEALLETAKTENAYMVGRLHWVDANGFDCPDGAHPYIHPHCALLHRETYLQLPPFEKHGAPCLSNQIEATQRKYNLIDFPVQEHIYHIGRGTVRTEGYGLGWQGKWASFRKRLQG